MLSLEIHNYFEEEAPDYLKTVKALFAMRRKTARSNLRQGFGLSQKDADNVLSEAGIDKNARAETLGVMEFINISKNLKKLKK